MLAALSEAELARLLPNLEVLSFTLGGSCIDRREMTHVYFPTDFIISLLYLMENGDRGEIGITGFEGMMLEHRAVHHREARRPNRAVVQSAGRAYRMSANALMRKFSKAACRGICCWRETTAGAAPPDFADPRFATRLHFIEAPTLPMVIAEL